MAHGPETDASGKATFAAFGKKGNDNGDFNQPLGMAFNHDKTEIFVADSHNNRVQVLKYNRETGKLNFDRTISDKIDDKGGTSGTLYNPCGVALGSYNAKPVILVADRGNSKVCRFNDDEHNHYIDHIDANSPCSVAVDKHGNIFTYDSSNCRIQILMNDRTTKYICEKGEGEDKGDEQLGGWGTLAFDNAGNLVVADEENNRVQVLKSSDGTRIRTITGTISSGGRGGQLNAPCGIAFTRDYENIIIANSGYHQVQVINYVNDVIVNTFGTNGINLGEFNGPYGVLVDDENGRIIVSEELNHRIQVIHNALPKKLAKVEGNPSKSKYPNLENAIHNAITAFSTSLGDHEYADILNELNEKIDKDRKRINNPESQLSELLAKVTRVTKGKEVKTKVKDAEPKLVSQLKTKDEVTNFIKDHEKDAIFVVTGGSFNPPHNGHIGMFQKAYEALIKEDKIKTGDGKKVYGVMVPAEDKWVDGKLCKEAHKKLEKCNDTELADKTSQAAIKSKRIQVAERVTLCKLSCDSYEWTDEGKFGAENMIVVNESGEGEQFTLPANTYYLCGSDYYQGTKGNNYICILRKGDVKTGTDLVKKDGSTIPIKATDIIVNGSDIDNDASSTMLREILTNIRDTDEYVADEPVSKKLLTKQVYCRLLDMEYIVGEKGKDIADSLKCNELESGDMDYKDIIPMKLTGNKFNDPNKDRFIQELVESFNAQNDKQPSERKSKINPNDVEETLNEVYNNGHYMLLNDIHFMNNKTNGLPLIFQLMFKKNLLLGDLIIKFEEMEDDTVYPEYKKKFDKLTQVNQFQYALICKFLFETKRTSILFHILEITDDKLITEFAGIMKGFYDDLLKQKGNARDAILDSVGYTFKSAYGDGNCFYNSAGMQLIGSVVDYNVYDKLNRNEKWQNLQLEKQSTLRTELTAYLKKLYDKLKTHSDFATSTNITIKYLRTNGRKDFVNVSTIRSGIGSQFWGTDDELYFIAALYDCFIVILPSSVTNFQTIEYPQKIDSGLRQDTLFKALSEPIILVLSPGDLTAKLAEVKTATKQIIFMLGGKGHWDYAIPIIPTK